MGLFLYNAFDCSVFGCCDSDKVGTSGEVADVELGLVGGVDEAAAHVHQFHLVQMGSLYVKHIGCGIGID